MADWLRREYGCERDSFHRAALPVVPPAASFLSASLACCFVLAANGATAAAGETLDRVLAAKTLVLAVDEEYPPFAARGNEGTMKGFDIDVARELAKRLDLALTIVTPGWNEIATGDWQGRWDIAMSGFEAAAASDAGLAAAAIYADAPAVILVKQGAAGIGSSSDLRGKRIGVEAGSRYESYLEKEAAGAEIVPFEIEPLAIDDLAKGNAADLDAVLLGLLAAQDAIGIGKAVQIGGPPLFSQPFVIAAERGDSDFEARIAAAIETMRTDGTLTRLSLEHLGIDTAPPAP